MINQDQFTFLQCSEESLKKFDLQVKDKRELLNLVNETLYRKSANTSKDKSEVLLLRDKLLKLIRYEIHSSSGEQTHILLTGACKDMCPEKERYSRECLNLCHKYELNENTNQPDHNLMIKEYSRSSADQDLPLPNEMRPLPVLYDTMLYLIDEIISKIESYSPENEPADFSICDWYDFIWNRTRSIRKDIIQQRLLLNDNKSHICDEYTVDNYYIKSGLGGVMIIEQCARFHIMCAHRLCDQSSQVFDFKINEENLKNCFQSLRQYYETSKDNKTLEPSPNEAEFKSYIILLNLNESNILCEIQRWPKYIRHSKHVRFALNIYFAFNSKNYVKFFRLIKTNDCEYLQACILHRYFYKVRSDAFKTIFNAFRDMSQGNKEKLFPISKLVDTLGFDDSNEAFVYCNMYGLDSNDDVNIRMKASIGFDCFSSLTKSNEDRLKFRRSFLLVENKFYYRLKSRDSEISNEECLSEIISGLGIDAVKNCRFLEGSGYELDSSFDQEGHYCGDEIEQLLTEAKGIITAPVVPKVTKHKFDNLNIQLKSALNHANKLKLKTAQELKKKAVVRQHSILSESSLKRERRKSASSSSSGSSETAKVVNEVVEESAAKKQQIQTTVFKGFALPVESVQQTSLFGQPIRAEVKQNPFSSILAKPKFVSEPLFGALSQQQVVKPPGNLFESLIKKQDVAPIAPQIKIDQNLAIITANREKLMDQMSEHCFQSIYLELIKDYLVDYLFKLKTVSTELCSYFIDSTVNEMLSQILRAEIEENFKNIANQKETKYRQMSEQIYNDFFFQIVRDTCFDFLTNQANLECIIYDDLLCNVFQKEFEIILKQIANEINNDLVLDRLAESIYFGDDQLAEDEPSTLSTTTTTTNNSMFMNDLRSLMHDSIYEFTRLNLNVNRELYYEIKQALGLNQQLYLFRKWRLKLSVRLLNREHRRASLLLKQRQTDHNSSINQQLHSISFASSYGTFLLQNLNKIQKLKFFLTPRSINLIHCDKFHQHLSLNTSLNYKYYLYEFLSENYFSLIHNRESEIVLQIPGYETDEFVKQQQINLKTIICFSSTGNHDTNNFILRKFFSDKNEKKKSSKIFPLIC